PPAVRAIAPWPWVPQARGEPPRSSPSPVRAGAMPTASPRRMSPDRASSLHHEIDAAVLRLAFFGLVAGDRLRRAIADRRETVGGKPSLDQVVADRLRSLFREHLIGGLVAGTVGMSGDLDRG